MRLPMYMLATKPQKTSGRWLIMSGPGCRPWTTRAPSRMAVAGEKGMPSERSGTIAPAVAPLLAASGPATPSIMPVPNFSGVFDIFFSTVYEMNVDSTAAGPGTSPVRKPTTEPRAIGIVERRHSSRVGRSSRSFTLAICVFAIPSSARSSTSATP